ncbi:N-terminal domain of NEFA-interacting nuclear protein NIP30-domain-containing protein [Lasiosphaeria miniovina]|uniref:N-terminal domain of NEFA-interacting nuclear protein NIP30-domain-containing protein n=1 Tax=Lasiosphaeria miniovina TaxID=1954250 RepID=A0AA40AU51_9PEZI|nr:N-terminal domain of NEFA-interacting nuclear protein NIP30-domain-containing protein [Lasiosphaeria miniovina]KAK0722018.1 N-terminal domain of NEFA-interacting nuclear protein NIP30-domain-containing protein [Lasiosphaeria miniovina]
MASRFVSAGAIDAATGEATAAAAPPPASSDNTDRKGNEWLEVTKQLEADRRRRDEARQAAATAAGPNGERTLFDVLQANKAAKQAAFEEAHRIRNQFRALDDDEIDFLDDVRASRRADEERLRRETEAGLQAFRAAQMKTAATAGGGSTSLDALDGTGGGADDVGEGGAEDDDHYEEEWAAGSGRKRRRSEKDRDKKKRVKGLLVGGAAIRRQSTAGSAQDATEKPKAKLVAEAGTEKVAPGPKKVDAGEKTSPLPPPSAAKPSPPALAKKLGGLVDYGSSDDDDDD